LFPMRSSFFMGVSFLPCLLQGIYWDLVTLNRIRLKLIPSTRFGYTSFEVFLYRPEVLKSSEQIDLMTVLSHESMDSLIRAVAERKVDDLSYRSFNDITKYFGQKFHIRLCTELEYIEINEAIAFRNISVHNRCVVNKRFIAQTGVDSSWLGKRALFGMEYLQDKAKIIANSVRLTDRAARKKLGLRGSRLNLSRRRDENKEKT
jgi:hypothetical protein